MGQRVILLRLLWKVCILSMVARCLVPLTSTYSLSNATDAVPPTTLTSAIFLIDIDSKLPIHLQLSTLMNIGAALAS